MVSGSVFTAVLYTPQLEACRSVSSFANAVEKENVMAKTPEQLREEERRRKEEQISEWAYRQQKEREKQEAERQKEAEKEYRNPW